ncbi:lytic transglycosylase domain-containing protein [Scatolibacter rhodanostii]|uniref:lytic transglycosylase domain-containing protein n=1 Tax=Scatolibacter rhodanostii TaxID=2014781 RepID=UPI000C077D49|nr:lytic transglycosylase domain-containing protein [Scatolibacter rhodanostii]
MKKNCSSLLFVLFIVFILGVLIAPKLIEYVLKIYYPQPYAEIVEEKSQAFSLDKNLVYAVIHAESKFDHKAESHAGASGLMQLTDETFEWINSKYPSEAELPNVLEPRDNIHAGCALLKLLLDHYGDLDVALSAYNAGMGNVDKWLADERYSSDGKTLHTIPFPETEKYVKKVHKNYEKYNNLYS